MNENLFPTLNVVGDPKMFTLLIIALIWIFYWKGRALWIAAKQSSVSWFIVMLVVNTFGILDILYIYYFSKKHKNK